MYIKILRLATRGCNGFRYSIYYVVGPAVAFTCGSETIDIWTLTVELVDFDWTSVVSILFGQ